MVNTVQDMLGTAGPAVQGNPTAEIPKIELMRLETMQRLCAAFEVPYNEDMRLDAMRKVVMAHAESGAFDGEMKHPALLEVVGQQPSGDPIYAMSLRALDPEPVAPTPENATPDASGGTVDAGDGWTVSWGGPAHKFRVKNAQGEVVQHGYEAKEAAIADVGRLKQG